MSIEEIIFAVVGKMGLTPPPPQRIGLGRPCMGDMTKSGTRKPQA